MGSNYSHYEIPSVDHPSPPPCSPTIRPPIPPIIRTRLHAHSPSGLPPYADPLGEPFECYRASNDFETYCPANPLEKSCKIQLCLQVQGRQSVEITILNENPDFPLMVTLCPGLHIFEWCEHNLRYDHLDNPNLPPKDKIGQGRFSILLPATFNWHRLANSSQYDHDYCLSGLDLLCSTDTAAHSWYPYPKFPYPYLPGAEGENHPTLIGAIAPVHSPPRRNSESIFNLLIYAHRHYLWVNEERVTEDDLTKTDFLCPPPSLFHSDW
jgi:hypothetical protein